MTINETATVSVSIDSPHDIVSADLADVTTHPEWATEFFAGPAEAQGDGTYLVPAPALGGTARVKVDADPAAGNIDMSFTPDGAPFGAPVPVRVIPNGDGADVLWTMTRRPGTSDEMWTEQLASIERELQTLKQRLEGQS